MKRYLLLYNGPRPSSPPTHEGWPEWFDKIGDALVDMGSPMANGVAVGGDGSTSETTSLNGFSIVQADSRERVLELVADHPFVLMGSEYRIEIFEVPRK